MKQQSLFKNYFSFQSKEQYKAIRKAWANAVNSKKAKSTLKPCTAWLSEGEEYSTGTMRVPGWIEAYHAILYNIVRGKPLNHGFTTPKKEGTPNKFNQALSQLIQDRHWVLVAHQKIQKKQGKFVWILHSLQIKNSQPKIPQAIVEKFEPFNGTLNPCNLIEMEELS